MIVAIGSCVYLLRIFSNTSGYSDIPFFPLFFSLPLFLSRNLRASFVPHRGKRKKRTNGRTDASRGSQPPWRRRRRRYPPRRAFYSNSFERPMATPSFFLFLSSLVPLTRYFLWLSRNGRLLNGREFTLIVGCLRPAFPERESLAPFFFLSFSFLCRFLLLRLLPPTPSYGIHALPYVIV